jgi:exonuclease VII small subunit
MVHQVDRNDIPLDLHILIWQRGREVAQQGLVDYLLVEVLDTE